MGAAESVALTKELFELTTFAIEKGWLERLLNLFRRRHRILVCGATGVGKSQLIRALSKLIPEALSMLDRTQFIERHRLKLDGQLFEFVDTPGDPLKAALRRDAYVQCVTNPVAAVINVVADGYHEYRSSSHRNPLTTTGRIQKKYLDAHRVTELDLLSEWSELLLHGKGQPPVISVINKADIWWDRRDEVRSDYMAGDYFKILSKANADHSVLDFSATVRRPFGSGLLAQTFDDQTRLALRATLFRTLLSVVGQLTHENAHVR